MMEEQQADPMEEVTSRIASIQENLVTEMRVVGAIYRHIDEQRAWAELAFANEQWRAAYLQAWQQGQLAAWERIGRFAQVLRRLTQDDDEYWSRRVAALALLAGSTMPQPGLHDSLINTQL